MTTWMDRGIRDEVDMAQFVRAQVVPLPDPRDQRIAALEVQVDLLAKMGAGYWHGEEAALARIAHLEAALRALRTELERHVYIEYIEAVNLAIKNSLTAR